MSLEQFMVVGSALLQRQRLRITYHARSTDKITQREVSPQRLIHHKGNWYLAGWRHSRNDLRSFSVDAIRTALPLNKRAREITEKRLHERFERGYGIFSGGELQHAILSFTQEMSRWVASEQWHTRQRGRIEPDGSYTLQVSYYNPQELVMDILRYGQRVKVLKPESLPQLVVAEAKALLHQYLD
jgi:predicted DNA-binding transcriptional regulator YafY